MIKSNIMDNFISFVLLSGGASTRMGTDKGLIELNEKPFIQHIIESVEDFLNLLNLKKKIPIKVSLHDNIQQEEYLDVIAPSILKEDQIIVDEEVWGKTFSDIPKPPQESILGIWSAMTELKNSSNNLFFLPCDTPMVSGIFLSFIFDKFFKDLKKSENNNGSSLGFEDISLYRNSIARTLQNSKNTENFVEKKYISYIPVWENGKFETLFSIYHIKSFLPIIEKKILSKQYSIQNILKDILDVDENLSDSTDLKQKYKIKLKTIPIEKEFGKEDLYLNNFLDINSIETLKQAEKIMQSKK
ncbi:MAG: NTP transferase domain-containing protein [archaeon]|nr:NTP transferase domain-containing protein [archaeon]